MGRIAATRNVVDRSALSENDRGTEANDKNESAGAGMMLEVKDRVERSRRGGELLKG